MIIYFHLKLLYFCEFDALFNRIKFEISLPKLTPKLFYLLLERQREESLLYKSLD